MDNKGNQNKNGKNPRGQNYAVLIMTMLFTLLCVAMMHNLWQGSRTHKMPYSEFNQMLKDHEVESVVIGNGKIQITPKEDSKKYGGSQGKYGNLVGMEYYTIPINDPDLEKKLDEAGVTTYEQAEVDATGSIIMLLLEWVLPIAAMFVIFNMMMKRMGGGGGIMGVGKSNAKVYVQKETGVTFKDVAGEDEAKESLTEVVDFLHNPGKYTKIGAKLPKGALLVGPPGTGKTLLAKAVAGEAKVPFFSLSGSDFVEMFVGVGASRVRDLFDKAKKTMPCIIFIDEIDAVGRQRGAGLGGGHDEREQTLNQLLVEMDGFDANDGVIVMAATNRADILDKALLRPGRFDRQVYVGLPDVKGREEILRVHTKNKPLGPDVSLKTIARSTAGFSGADLENLVNEAALLAARQGKKAITEKEIEEASVKVMMGPEKKSHVVTDEERRLTAYHETGHAITGYFSKHHDPVHQISIISRGGAGGYTMYLPEKDPSYVTKTAMFENIVTLLGGRVAEQLVLEDISTGASSDLQRATDTARAMVTRYGFSERMGPVVYGSDPGETFLGRDFGQGKGYSEAIASEIDNEIRDIVDEAYETARRTLTEHMNELHKVAGVLMEREKISGEEFKTLMEGGTLPPYDLGRGETAQPEAPAPDSAAPVQPAEQPETQQPAEPANPQPDAQE